MVEEEEEDCTWVSPGRSAWEEERSLRAWPAWECGPRGWAESCLTDRSGRAARGGAEGRT